MDKSQEAIETALEKNRRLALVYGRKSGLSNVEYDLVDVLKDPSCLDKYAGCNKVFIDINGNRMLQAVEECIAIAKARIIGARLIVVKSRELFRKLRETQHSS